MSRTLGYRPAYRGLRPACQARVSAPARACGLDLRCGDGDNRRVRAAGAHLWAARYALMTATAMGAAASAPNPPPCTMTPTAMFCPGTKQLNTASFSPVLLTPFWAVPVLPSMVMPPVAWGPAVAYAVPPGLWVTAFIICSTSLAVDGEIAWLSTELLCCS